MANAQEKFYHELIAMLENEVSHDSLERIAKQLTRLINEYEISTKCTDVIEYDPFPACVKTYLVTRKIEGAAISTLGLYALRLRQFFETVKKPIEQITANDIRFYLYYIQDTTKCSDITLDCTRSIIATFFKWANAEGYISSNPCISIRPIKCVKKERTHLSEVEIETIRNSCKTLRDKAIIEVLYSTGCRVSELINIKISDLDFSKKEVTLFGKGSKFRKSYINTRAELAINEYLKSRTDNSENLFVSLRAPHDKIKKATVEKVVAELGINAGLTRKIFPHLIRHTTATIGLQRGMNIVEIQKMLGHENVETTMVYAKVAEETVKNSHKKFII